MKIPYDLIPYTRENEPMAAHTTFKTGGPARYYVKPPAARFIPLTKKCVQWARENDMPFFILGGGANLCVSDNGIRGIVLDTADFSALTVKQKDGGRAGETAAVFEIEALCGARAAEAARFACANSLSGLEFLSGLPGTIGGAVYMNARCFEKEISDVFIFADILDENLEVVRVPKKSGDWDYKKSPFQNRAALILSACFKAEYGNKNDIYSLGAHYQKEREEKGHYRFPSAGSVFKNNRSFGKPSGKIIDELGLCGKSEGGAQIAPWHGNFIINRGNASSSDIRALVERVKTEARKRAGVELEEEILFAGEW